MRRFAQVDVFTSRAGRGNPVAVVLDSEGLPEEEMQRLAHWTNLSETTFVLPPTRPEADYRVRIFTPDRELPFAGHPTIGTAAALLDAGDLKPGPAWVQECEAGLVDLKKLADGALAFAAPAPAGIEPFADENLLARALGGVRADQPTIIQIGPRWLTGRVTVDELNRLKLDHDAYLQVSAFTPDLTLYAVDNSGDLHVRSFFLQDGQIAEDPVCGSGNACVAKHVQFAGLDASLGDGYRAFQGSHRGRDGRISVALGEQNWVGGQAVTVVSGTISL